MKNIFKRVASDSLIKHSGLMFGSSLAQNGLNFVYWLAMVRMLDPVHYGILNALVALVSFFSTNGSVLQTVITRFISLHTARDDREAARTFLAHMGRLIGAACVLFIVFFVLFGRSVMGFMQLNDMSYVVLIAAGITLSMGLALAMGTLQGLQQFKGMAVNGILHSAMKLGIGVLLVFMGLRAHGAFLGFLAAFVASVLFCLWLMPAWLRSGIWLRTHARPMEWKGVLPYFVPVFLSTLSFYLFTNADVVLVKHFFSPLDAGYYSVGQIVGKVALFFPSAVGLVMFPKVVDAHAKEEDIRPLLAKSLSIVGILCVPIILAATLWPAWILTVLAGKAPAQALELVRFFALSMSCFALVQILMLYHLSRHNNLFIYVLVGAAFLQVAAITFFHASLVEVVRILVITSCALVVWGVTFSLRGGRRARA